MQITTVDAISANGNITRGAGTDAREWTSPEDWQHFTKFRDSYPLIVMGSGTYEAVRPEPEPGRLRVVLTRNPKQYATQATPNQLEFVNADPQEFIKQMEARGYSRMLLVGGMVNTLFWAAGLVDEAYITIEPCMFGQGQQLAAGRAYSSALRLQSVRQLNERGTLLLHYRVDSAGSNTAG